MQWLADECVAAALVRELRDAGHDVSYIAESEASATDTAVLGLAHVENRLLLTEDKDFGELIFRSRMPVPGVAFLRLGFHDNSIRWERLKAAIDQFGQSLFGRYVVIEDKRFRSRPLLRSMQP